MRSYDAKDSGKRWVTEVIANTFEFIERKGDGNKEAAVTKNPSAMDSFGEEIPGAVPFDKEISF